MSHLRITELRWVSHLRITELRWAFQLRITVLVSPPAWGVRHCSPEAQCSPRELKKGGGREIYVLLSWERTSFPRAVGNAAAAP